MEDRMQEAGPTRPTEDELDDAPSPSDMYGSDRSSEGGASSPATLPARGGDPVVRWLALAIGGVIVFWLVSVLSALLFGLLTPPSSPRTAAERDLGVLAAQVQSGKANSATYARYVDTLIRADQLSRAQAALDEALRTTKTDRSYLLSEQAQLALARKDYRGAVTSADKAMAEAQKELTAFIAKNVANNRKPLAGAQLPDSYQTAALAKAEALVGSKDSAAAIKAFGVYLAQQPTDSDILVQRATVEAEVGDKKAAEADYRAALKYVPDYQPALDGLKEIGAAR
jgi:tetratricopeptide (TPR) repeat protein